MSKPEKSCICLENIFNFQIHANLPLLHGRKTSLSTKQKKTAHMSKLPVPNTINKARAGLISTTPYSLIDVLVSDVRIYQTQRPLLLKLQILESMLLSKCEVGSPQRLNLNDHDNRLFPRYVPSGSSALVQGQFPSSEPLPIFLVEPLVG
jgi:hypothetical protein